MAKRFLDKDPRRALREIDEIENRARESLAKVRYYVENIRKPDFEEEWKSAIQALQTAEIEGTWDQGPTSGSLHEEVDQVFAMCLREAVTNILRHTKAKHVMIQRAQRDDYAYLWIADDGIGLPATWPSQSSHSFGLIGMQTRMRERKGKLLIWSNGAWLTEDRFMTFIFHHDTLPFDRGTMLCCVTKIVIDKEG
nr:hypothetical protein [Bacilli bacterium]